MVVNYLDHLFVGFLIDLFLMDLFQKKCQMLYGEFGPIVKNKAVNKTSPDIYRPITN